MYIVLIFLIFFSYRSSEMQESNLFKTVWLNHMWKN